MLLLPSEVLNTVVWRCRIAYPAEACGIIAGPAGQPATGTAVADRVIRMANVAAEPRAGFAFDPAEQLAAYQEMDERGEDPVVLWHSHPDGPPVPSPIDVQAAVGVTDTRVWLIVSLATGEPVVRCWRLKNGGLPVEDELRVVDRDRSAVVQR